MKVELSHHEVVLLGLVVSYTLQHINKFTSDRTDHLSKMGIINPPNVDQRMEKDLHGLNTKLMATIMEKMKLEMNADAN